VKGLARVGATVACAALICGFSIATAGPRERGPASGEAPAVTRGPYLQRLVRDTVTVVWHQEPAAACAVELRHGDAPPRVIRGGAATACVVEVAGLEPNVDYHYRALANGVPVTPETTFRTGGAQAGFSFVVFGDSGCACPSQLAVRDRMLGSAASFLLHTGDMIYRKVLRPEDFDHQIFSPYRDLMDRAVLWPCLGNHDRERDDGTIWRDVFFTPANNPENAKDYYSFDYGSAHVVVIDSNAPTGKQSAQRRFLDRDLAASAAPWKFVVLHHSLYSSGKHGGSKRIRRNLVPLFDKHGVSVVFMGHEHSYERTKPMRDGEVVRPEHGVVYVTTGGGGKSIRPVGRSWFTAYSESAFHFTRVTVDRDALSIEMVRADGVVRDRVRVPRRTA
jgi:hypothetical protein